MRILDLPVPGLVVVLGLAIAAMQVSAASPQNEIPGIPDALLNSPGFLNAHPDLLHRRQGSRDYAEGRFDRAAAQFERAARHADKPSQAMLAEMHWDGSGVNADRALAYAWMDLASERAYRQFLLRREAMWLQLDTAEQSRAIEVGQSIYDRYGDRVAKPRLEAEMRRAFRAATGSRVNPGSLNLRIGHRAIEAQSVPQSDTFDDRAMPSTSIEEAFYNERFWVAEQYWQLQDAQWADRPTYEVVVRPIQTDAMEPVGQGISRDTPDR